MTIKNKFLICLLLLFCKNLQSSQLEENNALEVLSNLPKEPFEIIKKHISPNLGQQIVEKRKPTEKILNNEDDDYQNLGLSLKKKFRNAQKSIEKSNIDGEINNFFENQKYKDKKITKNKILDQSTQYELNDFIESGQQTKTSNQTLYHDDLETNVKKWLGKEDSFIEEDGKKYSTYQINDKFCCYFIQEEYLQIICKDNNLARKMYIKGPTKENLEIIKKNFVERFMENLDFILENQKGEKFALWQIFKNYILSENLYDEVLNVKNHTQFIKYAQKHKSCNPCFRHHTFLSAISYVLYEKIGLSYLSFSEGVIQSNGGFEYLRESNDLKFFDLIDHFEKVIYIGCIRAGQKNYYSISLLSGKKPDENDQENNFEMLEKKPSNKSNTSKSNQIL